MSSEEKKEEAPKPPEGPKKILEELEKNAAPVAKEEAPPAESLPELPPEPAPTEQAEASPLITDAMRRLDELLARFRNPS